MWPFKKREKAKEVKFTEASPLRAGVGPAYQRKEAQKVPITSSDGGGVDLPVMMAVMNSGSSDSYAASDSATSSCDTSSSSSDGGGSCDGGGGGD